MRGTAALVTAAVAVTLGLGACAGSAPTAAAPASTTASSITTPTTSTTSATTAPTIDPTESPTSQPPRPSVSVTTPTTPDPTSVTAVPSAAATRWPKALGEPAQGDPVWAVYLAIGHARTDPALETALQQAAAVGYEGVQVDLACDQGATEALGLDQFDYWSAVAVYLATEHDATDFVASYQAKVAEVAGVTRVNVGCLD